jgi:hypothetical protein
MRSLSTFGQGFTRQLDVVIVVGGWRKRFLGLWECYDNVDKARDEAIVDWVRLRFEGRMPTSTSVSPASSRSMRQSELERPQQSTRKGQRRPETMTDVRPTP